MPLTRLDIVDGGTAYAVAGAEPELGTAGNATIALGAEGSVITVPAGDDLADSGVRTGEDFALVGPVPLDVASRFLGYLLPPDTRGGPWGERKADERPPIHLFVELEAGFLYLGTGELGYSLADENTLYECVLRMESPLGRDVLDIVRPPSEPGPMPGLDWLEQVDGDKAGALRLFIEGWHPEPVPCHAESASVPIPRALEEFYRLARGRPGVLGVQNYIYSASQLKRDATGMLELGHENQGGFVWYLETTEQPLVRTDTAPGEQGGLCPGREPLDAFLLQFSLFEALVSAPYNASHHRVEKSFVDELTRELEAVPMVGRLYPGSTERFFVAPGLIAEVSPAFVPVGTEPDGHYSVGVGAKHRALLRPFADLGWSHFDG
jgi:hypothetical protein